MAYLDRDDGPDTSDHKERDLDVESISPSQGIVDVTTIYATETHAGSEDDVTDPLPDSALTKRNQVGGHEHGNRVQAASAGTGHDSSEDDDPSLLCNAAQQCPYREERDCKDEPRPTTVDVGHFAGKRLEGRIGNQIAGRDPSKGRSGTERGADGSGQSGHNGGIYRRVRYGAMSSDAYG